jgi:hypothetical protein
MAFGVAEALPLPALYFSGLDGLKSGAAFPLLDARHHNYPFSMQRGRRHTRCRMRLAHRLDLHAPNCDHPLE